MAFNIFSRFKEILFKNSNQQAEIETAIDSDTERNVEIISEDLMFSNIYEGREFNDDEIIAFKNQREYKKAVLAANELLHLDSFKELGQQMVEIIEDIRSCEYDKKILNDFFADIYEKMKQENMRLDAEKTKLEKLENVRASFIDISRLKEMNKENDNVLSQLESELKAIETRLVNIPESNDIFDLVNELRIVYDNLQIVYNNINFIYDKVKHILNKESDFQNVNIFCLKYQDSINAMGDIIQKIDYLNENDKILQYNLEKYIKNLEKQLHDGAISTEKGNEEIKRAENLKKELYQGLSAIDNERRIILADCITNVNVVSQLNKEYNDFSMELTIKLQNNEVIIAEQVNTLEEAYSYQKKKVDNLYKEIVKFNSIIDTIRN